MREQAELREVELALPLDPSTGSGTLLEHHLGQNLVQANVNLHAGAAQAAALLDADLTTRAVVRGVAGGLAVVGDRADIPALDSPEADASLLASLVNRAGGDRLVTAGPRVAAAEGRAGGVDEGANGGGCDNRDGGSDDRDRGRCRYASGTEAGASAAVCGVVLASRCVGGNVLGGGGRGINGTVEDCPCSVQRDGLEACLGDKRGAVIVSRNSAPLDVTCEKKLTMAWSLSDGKV